MSQRPGCTYHKGRQARGSNPSEPEPWGLQMPVLSEWRDWERGQVCLSCLFFQAFSGQQQTEVGLAVGKTDPAVRWRVSSGLLFQKFQGTRVGRETQG